MTLLLSATLASALAQDAVVVPPPSLAADPVRPDAFSRHTSVVPDTRKFSGQRAILVASHVRDPLVFRPAGSDEVIAIVGPVWGMTGGLAWSNGPIAVAATLPAQFAIGSDLHDDRPASALGDIALDGRFVGLDATSAPVGVSGQLRLTAPLGGDDQYMGQPGFTWELLAVGEVTPASWAICAAIGTRGVPEVEIPGQSLDDLLVYRLAVSHALATGGLTGEFLGQRQYQGFVDDPSNSPLEVLLGGWVDLDEDERHTLRGALGWGVNPGIGSPQVRVLVGVGSLTP